jgi:hypothetical protein
MYYKLLKRDKYFMLMGKRSYCFLSGIPSKYTFQLAYLEEDHGPNVLKTHNSSIVPKN